MNNSNKFIINLLPLIIAVVFIFWLVLDNIYWSNPKSAIEKALRQNTIGMLSLKENQELQRLLDELASVSDCNIRVILNKPFSEKGLNVFTTSSQQKKLTKCEYADAIYNVGLDAVFLDEALLRSSRISCTFGSCSIDYSKLRNQTAEIYLRYLILHEFGHRCLHRNLNFLSIFHGAKKREREADSFAQEKLQQLEEKGQLTSPAAKARWFHLPPSTKIPSSDRVHVALADMANEITEMLLFSDAPYSSISPNKTHDSFVNRSLDALERSNSMGIESRDVSSYVNLAIQQIERIQDVTPLLKAEIYFQEITEKVSFEKDHLIVLGKKGGIFSIPYSKIRRGCHSKPCIAKKINSLPSNLVTDLLNSSTEVFATKTFGTLISVPGKGFFSISQNKWIEISDSMNFSFNWEYILTPSQPDDVFIIVSRKDRNQIFNYVQLDRSTISKSQINLCREISLRGGPQKCSLEPAFAGDKIYFLVKDQQNNNRTGIGFIDYATFKVTKYIELRPPPSFHARSNNIKFIVTHDSKKWFYYAVTNNFNPYSLHKEKYQITLWKFSEVDNTVEIIDQHQLILEGIPKESKPGDWLNVQHPSLLTCENISSSSVICTVWNDSIYGFNSVTEKLYPVFHPSGVNKQLGLNDLVAYWTNNGQKVIIMNGSKNDL